MRDMKEVSGAATDIENLQKCWAACSTTLLHTGRHRATKKFGTVLSHFGIS